MATQVKENDLPLSSIHCSPCLWCYDYYAECSSTVAGVTSGTATGICYTVTDLSDNSTSGVIFRYESETNGLLYLNSLQYSDGECQNYVQNGPFPIVEGCEKFENGWMSVAYTTDKTPWDQFPPGLFELYYDTIDHCKEGGVYGQFVHYTLNYCFPGEPLMLTQCNGGKYTFAEFVDDECHNSDFSYTSSLKLCESVEYDDDAKTTEMFYTQECKEKWWLLPSYIT